MKPFRPTCVAVLTAALSLLYAPIAGAFHASSADRAENTPLHLATSTATHASTASATGGSITRTLVGLVIVVALIYAIAWVLRRLKRREGHAVGSSLESVASLPLGPGRSLALVRAGSELVLVGVAEHQITPIRRYSEAEALAAGLIDEDEDAVRVDTLRVDTLTNERARTLSSAIGGDRSRTEPTVQGLLQTLRRWTVRS